MELIRYTTRTASLLGLGGVGFLLLLGKGDWAWGFLLGFGASLGNFRLLVYAVTRLMQGGREKGPRYLWKGLFLRLGGVGLFLLLALKFLKADLFALAFGLLLGQVGILGLLVFRGVTTLDV